MTTRPDLPRIVTAAQMRAIDERAIAGMKIPSLSLMENAGRGVAARIRERLFDGDPLNRRVMIVCGRGNNGGDGFVVGRYLAEWGARVEFCLIGGAAQLKGDAKANHDRAIAQGLTVSEIGESGPVPDFSGADLLVDAIFGTGFRGPVTGIAIKVIAAMNAAGVRIVSVDTPSGLDSDSGGIDDSTVTAYDTMSLACSKRGQWLWPGRAHVGSLETIDIGIPAEAVEAEGIKLSLITEDFVRKHLPPRPEDAHKGTFGKAVVVGGSAGMSGAVVLAANAALRTGVGLAYAACPLSLVDAVDTGSIETVVLGMPEVQKRRVLARRALGEIAKHIEHVDAVAIGPGLGRHYETQELVRRLVARRRRPTVLDADGLNAFAKEPALLGYPNEVPLIITPHVAEMARLLQKPNEEISTDREGAAREAAAKFNCIAVMKGAPTFVATPDGEAYLNPTGNSGMATGGMGDVLTGIIVSLLAQSVDPLRAALLGVYIHGMAGDFAAADVGERSLLAGDVVGAISDVLQFLE